MALTALSWLALFVSCRQTTSAPDQSKAASSTSAVRTAPAASVDSPGIGGATTPSLSTPPPEPQKSPAALARERAARAIERATIARLDARVAPKAAEAASPTHWAGFRVLSGTERQIDESGRVALASWLRASDGFDDTIVRRCARAHMVGLLLFGNGAAAKDERTDVAVDFACNAILVVSDDGQGRTLTSGFFDASRATLLALIRKALPNDKELARLR